MIGPFGTLRQFGQCGVVDRGEPCEVARNIVNLDAGRSPKRKPSEEHGAHHPQPTRHAIPRRSTNDKLTDTTGIIG